MKKFHRNRSQGIALLLVLWAVALLSSIVLSVLYVVDYKLNNFLVIADEHQAYLAARTGLTFGLNPQIKNGDPLLFSHLESDKSFTVTFSSEASRLQINSILMNGQRDVLSRLFTQWGLQSGESDSLINAMLDWVASPAPHQRGPTEEQYERAGLPKKLPHRPFNSVREMRLVWGMEILDRKHANWENSFTVWTNGLIDLSEASADVISAISGLSYAQAAEVCQYRESKKARFGEAVPAFSGMEEVQSTLGFKPEQFALISSLFVIGSPLRRIESNGYFKKLSYHLSVIVDTSKQPIQYLEWHET